jgi:hypothetical protein
MQQLSPEDEKNIRNYVEEFEQQGNASNVYHLRMLLNEIDRLREQCQIKN